MESVFRRLEGFFAAKEDAPLTPAEAAVCLEWLQNVSEVGDLALLYAPLSAHSLHAPGQPLYGDTPSHQSHSETPDYPRHTGEPPAKSIRVAPGMRSDSGEDTRTLDVHPEAPALSHPSSSASVAEAYGQLALSAEASAGQLSAVSADTMFRTASSGICADAPAAGLATIPENQSAANLSAVQDELSAIKQHVRDILSSAHDADGASLRSNDAAESDTAAVDQAAHEHGAAPAEEYALATEGALEILRAIDGESSEEAEPLDSALALPANTASYTESPSKQVTVAQNTIKSPVKAKPFTVAQTNIESPVKAKPSTVAQSISESPIKSKPASVGQTSDSAFAAPFTHPRPAAANTPGAHTPSHKGGPQRGDSATPVRTPGRAVRLTPLPHSIDSSPKNEIINLSSSESSVSESASESSSKSASESSSGSESESESVSSTESGSGSESSCEESESSAESSSVPRTELQDDSYPNEFVFDLSSVSERRLPATDDLPTYAFNV